MCTGNAPNIDIGLENAGVKFTRNGIKVDERMRTSVKNIYAAGDVLGGHSSTDKALIEARVAVAQILGHGKVTVDYRGIIRATDIVPQVAEVGETEDDLIRHDAKYNKLVLPLNIIQEANTSDDTMGFIKLITAKKTNKIIGATIMAPHAGLIIQEIALAIRYDMSTYDLANAPHLTNDWSELVRAACEQV